VERHMLACSIMSAACRAHGRDRNTVQKTSS